MNDHKFKTCVLLITLCTAIAFSQEQAPVPPTLPTTVAPPSSATTPPPATPQAPVPVATTPAPAAPQQATPAAPSTQKEAIKFQVPTAQSGTPAPAALPPKPDTAQKAEPAQNAPLNLAVLSAKDTASFETYSKRLSLVQDSISATNLAIGAVKTNSESLMPPLEPKGEFEKQAEFDVRQAKWKSDLNAMAEKDIKSLNARLEELQKAKIKIQENQVSLYGSLSITSTPSAASIFIDKEEIGATPAEYSLLIPGSVKISLRKEGYNQWDTTLQVAQGAKLKFSVSMEEKSIFSQENEIDFSKILSKDTTIQGYESRIVLVKARKTQIDAEIQHILVEFPKTYPVLEVQRPNETAEQFSQRHDAWSKEGMRQYTVLQEKHSEYSGKLERTIQVLNDYIISGQSALVTELSTSAKIELGAYDAEKETFEIVAQDSASEKSPFYFSGKLGVPLELAKALDRNAPGFVASVQFINYPFETEKAKVNLAMSKLNVSNSTGNEFKTEGSFSEIGRYKPMEGYGPWKLRADSLLSGTLKPNGFDYNYAMGKEAAKDAVAEVATKSDSGGGLGWRGWTRITTFTLAAACGGAAVFKHLKAQKYRDNIKDLKNNGPYESGYNSWRDKHNQNADFAMKNEDQRGIYAIGAGSFALVGIATFFF